MQNYKSYIIAAGLIAFCSAVSSCKKNFAEINTNPSVVTTPDIKYLLTYAEDRVVTYQGTEWVWESMEQLFRFTQHMTTDPYEMTNNVNTRYGNYYLQILPNLFEIRKQIDAKPDKDNYKKMGAVTYVLQALHGIKVTDMNGSVPYSEAVQGRYEGNFNPTYDKQEDLFTQWLTELDNAITVLSDNNLPNQNTYGSADVFYKSDWTKWLKLANSLKLRIAARLDVANNAKTREIFQQVMQNAIGPIEANEDQLSYQNIDYLPFGTSGDINYRSTRYATTSIMKFLKTSNDPRLPVYFEPNDLQGKYKDTLTKYGVTLPAFIDPADPLIRFQGGPADFTTNPSVANYIKNPFAVGNTNTGNSVSRYFLISPINRKFFSPRYNSATSGDFRDVIVTAAETCFLIAEFIQKGYAGSVNTRGTAEDWYKKGIASSIKTMNDIAIAAGSTTIAGDVDAAINAYLANPAVKFSAVNDLERIYIQQYLNFYRNANEAFVFVRRTGYPKKVSVYYAREPFNETIPRRFWTIDPGEANRTNWQAAMTDQGFTPNAQDLPTLSTQRIWYDKTAPNFGEGD
ncbi:SusD/RagB family nutrient-binding outer membrane lipoprotein [Terrimonas pollutisoli]|uniref:SusD/RagB family nutrient-binding outer membrane lipoprotein n=1 Tax=Terrimonas pollutisoli TaxID=3034147 RepID=UPI0023EB63DD|nr:SusD/RagB family nutrient-binding outer membrane lipoprotein [Terrimonas sp. H1YJ31]